MILTDVQQTSLIADMQANAGSLNAGDTAGQAIFYNAPAVPDYFVWNPNTKIADIANAITWANLTPTDAVPDATATAPAAATWLNRAIACQGKQFNLQLMIANKTEIDATLALIRAGLQDALTNIPSGVSGALVSGGWVPVKTALARKATRLEKLFATGNGTATTPSIMAVVGNAQPIMFSGLF